MLPAQAMTRDDPAHYDPFLAPRLEARLPGFARYRADLNAFHGWVRSEVNAQANATDQGAPPRLDTYDREGRVVNRITLNAPYAAQHRELYRRGMVGRPYREGAPQLLSFVMGYLLSQADISLHCPATLSGAVAYVLAHHAPAELRDRFLPPLTRLDGEALSGGTWATELHGGSDVGATATEARPEGGHFRLHGLKWFASNANSGLALATARPSGAPAGSAGLGLYLVPSHLEGGAVNDYRIRRLKDKLGTRGLPTGEVELLGALAHEVAPPPEGFRLMLEALTYSRVHNAVGAAGSQKRSLDEALAWAGTRRAFGEAIIGYPMVQHTLLDLFLRWRAGSLLAFEAALALEGARGGPERTTWLRLVTALAKYLTAEEAVDAARSALELIGGNGYTNDYPAARLLRDAQVLTVWEGPANVQALELLRLLAPRYGGFQLYTARVTGILDALPAELDDLRAALEARLAGDRAAHAVTTASPEQGQRYARQLLHRLAQSLALALLMEDAARWPEAAPVARAYADRLSPPPFGAENREVEGQLMEELRRLATQLPQA